MLVAWQPTLPSDPISSLHPHKIAWSQPAHPYHPTTANHHQLPPTATKCRQLPPTPADVKYHLGQSGCLSVTLPGPTPRSQSVELSIAPNPSHLGSVCPVVLGMVRADQARRRAAISRDEAGWQGARRAVMGLLIHGDAAFSGLGLSAETLQVGG